MVEEKLKCKICSYDLRIEFFMSIPTNEPIICPKCGSKYKIIFENNEPFLELILEQF